MRVCSLRWAAWLAPLVLVTAARGADAPKVPDRQLPSSVLAGLRLLEQEFRRTLMEDCAPERCFAKGCSYISHMVVDRPATSSLPGLGLDPGPGSEPSQVFLTTAECSFAHESSVRDRDARALATRLKAKLSRGWTQVDVVYEKLEPLPEFLRESPDPPAEAEPEVFVDDEPPDEPEVAAKPAPEPPVVKWDAPTAGRELWLNLLPHLAWMIGVVLVTFAALILVWAVRRLGRASPEEQALLAQMVRESNADPAALLEETQSERADRAEARLSAQHEAWRERLARSGPEPDPALQALVTDLLRAGERRLLAKAVMLFPDELPRVFPTGGDLASAKFSLAEFLKHADPASLPSDEVFFEKLDRYAMAASLTAHPDTDLIRSLHDDFGVSALVELVGTLPARHGALLFALAPEPMQHEAVGSLSPARLAEIADQLMRSDRMDPAETDYLLAVLSALRSGTPIPAAPPPSAVSDRGSEFNATASLSVVLPRLDAETRGALAQAAARRNGGRLPAWMHHTLYGEMLLWLDDETRTDLLLEVPVEQIAAWLRVQTAEARAAILERAPAALRVAIADHPPPASDDGLHALANDGRAALSAALRRRLTRGDLPFPALLG